MSQQQIQPTQYPDEIFRFDECSFCCRKFEPDEIRMQCLECKYCFLCFDCYLIQPPFKSHKPNHLMFPLSNYNDQLFSDGFSLKDTLLLIQGIMYYGLHSWDQVIELIGKQYTNEQICRHFMTLFNHNDGLIIPNSYITQEQNQKGIQSIEELQQLFTNKYQQQPLLLASNPNLMNYPPMKQLSDKVLITGEGNGQEIISGCYPLRKDFQIEYINKAEMPIMYLSINHHQPETKESMNLKIQLLQSYAFRLIQRHELKKLIFKYHQYVINPTGIEESQYKYLIPYLQQNPGYKFNLNHAYLYRLNDDNLIINYFESMKQEKYLRLEIYRYQTALMMGYKFIKQINQQQDIKQMMQNQQLVQHFLARNKIDSQQMLQQYFESIQEYISEIDQPQHEFLKGINEILSFFVVPRLNLNYQLNSNNSIINNNYLFEKTADQSLMLQLQMINILILQLLFENIKSIQTENLKLVYESKLLEKYGITVNQLHKLEIWQEIIYDNMFNTDINKVESQMSQNTKLKHFIKKYMLQGQKQLVSNLNSKYQIKIIKQMIITNTLAQRNGFDNLIELFVSDDEVKQTIRNYLFNMRIKNPLNANQGYGSMYDIQYLYGNIQEESDDDDSFVVQKQSKGRKNQQQHNNQANNQQQNVQQNKQIRFKYNYIDEFIPILNHINSIYSNLNFQTMLEQLSVLDSEENMNCTAMKNQIIKIINQNSVVKKDPKTVQIIKQLNQQDKCLNNFKQQFNIKRYKVKQVLTAFDLMICVLCDINFSYFMQIKSYIYYNHINIDCAAIHFLQDRVILAEMLSFVWSGRIQTYGEKSNQQETRLEYTNQNSGLFFDKKVRLCFKYQQSELYNVELQQPSGDQNESKQNSDKQELEPLEFDFGMLNLQINTLKSQTIENLIMRLKQICNVQSAGGIKVDVRTFQQAESNFTKPQHNNKYNQQIMNKIFEKQKIQLQQNLACMQKQGNSGESNTKDPEQ